jgi:hypothetical protein
MTRGFFGTLFILIMFFAIKAIVGIFKVGTTAIKKSIEEKKPKTQCPKCHKIFFIETHHIGKEFTCDNCWTTFSIKELIILKSASSYNTKLENRSLNTDNIDNNYLDNTSIEDIELNAEKI